MAPSMKILLLQVIKEMPEHLIHGPVLGFDYTVYTCILYGVNCFMAVENVIMLERAAWLSMQVAKG